MVKMIRCRNCNGKNIKKIIFLGKQVVSSIFPKKKTNNKNKYSLDLYKCNNCELVQLGKSIPLVKFDEKMSNAIIIMTKKSFGCLGVVNKNKKIIGIITDGDLRRKINSKFFEKKASEIMTKNPTIASKDMIVEEALSLMNNKKITSLFVCEDKIPIGIIHIHDLLRLTS